MLFLGFHLLACFLSGIEPLPDSEVTIYTIKCIIMSLALPSLIYWYTVSNYYLSDQVEEYEERKIEYERELSNYQQRLQRLDKEYQELLKQHEIALSKAEALSKSKVVSIRSRADFKGRKVDIDRTLSLPMLVSAYTGKKKLSEKEKQELIKYLEEL